MNFREEFGSLLSQPEKKYLLDSSLCEFAENSYFKNKNNESLPKLYRYMPANYHTIRELETQKLFLSEIGSMNDVFEGLSCEINDDVIKNIEELHDMAYIKSFTENEHDLMMWGQYADNYSGMCISYDLNEMKSEYLYHLFPIYYSNIRFVKANLEYTYKELLRMKRDIKDQNSPSESDFLKDIMGLCLTKSLCWKSEKEWRLVFTYPQIHSTPDTMDDDECKKLYDIDQQLIDFPYSKKVFLGPKMKYDIKCHLSEICNRLKIPVFETYLSPATYSLEEKLFTM